MQTISRYIMTLALLLTAVTGAWADGKVYTSAVDITALQVGDILTEGASINGSGTINFDLNRVKVNGTLQTEGFIYLYTNDFDSFGAEGVISLSNNYTISPVDKDNNDGNAWEVTQVSFAENNNRINIQGITYAPAPIEVTPVAEPAANTKQWTFAMPGSDVVLTPIYAKAAAFATTGTEPEVKTLQPEAAEGVIAGTDASLIAEGTGIVAFAGESTEVTQGTLMYAIGTSATEAPALTAFSATVPTAENVADDGATLYVWYYIKGADAPDGQQATEENTFNDSEICATPLTVQVLTNKFDITLKAANANTIEAGKATVTVGGTAATVTDGKLQGVKMGSEVKMTAKEGYKFRKVEVKKKAEVLTITVAKGSTDLSGDKLLYYTPGETYRQAIANHPENKLDGGLGWNIWENGNDATIFYKESADKSRDLSIDGDQHFRPTDSINLDTVIDPTLNFYFVAQF